VGWLYATYGREEGAQQTPIYKIQWKRESGRIKSGRCKKTGDEKLVEKNFR
jgi:hypothetical protein